MLHRMKLQVVYRGALAAAGPAARRARWIVMGVAGLGAYALYKGATAVAPLGDAAGVLLLAGLYAMPVAVLAYARGCGRPLAAVCREAPEVLAGLSLRVGVLYAWQLSLMVLALLDVTLGYDVRAHPAGPGVMALMISASAVARDAHQIGMLHKMTGLTSSRWAFPDGHGLKALRDLHPAGLAKWVSLAAAAGAATPLVLAPLAGLPMAELMILVATGMIVGLIATHAYFAVRQRAGGWRETAFFFIWPAFTFFCTYALILLGLRYLLPAPPPIALTHAIVGAVTGGASAGLLVLNLFHLGILRRQETLARAGMPEALLRCPFVLSILKKKA